MKFSDLYDTYFPKKQIKLKSKDLQSPWIMVLESLPSGNNVFMKSF